MTRLLSALFAASLCACGGTGTVKISITGASEALSGDLDGATAVNVAVKDIEVHAVSAGDPAEGDPDDTSVDGDNKWVALGESKSLDLLALESAEQIFGETAAPEGKITQIRLLIDSAGTNNVMKGEETCTLSLLSQTGVKVSHPFKAIPVQAGQTTEILLRLSAAESVSKQAGGGCAYRLSPVLHIKAAKVAGEDVNP
jgi:hypothetical protein